MKISCTRTWPNREHLKILEVNVLKYFITLLLWYPAFEIFFSIIRKLNFNRSPLKPDTNHLHQLIYFFLQKKITNTVLASSSVGLLISLYNLINIEPPMKLFSLFYCWIHLFFIFFSHSIYTYRSSYV